MSFAKGNAELIQQAAESELNSIRQAFGNEYHSNHEAWAVLKEELEEAEDAMERVKYEVETGLWRGVKQNSISDDRLTDLENSAMHVALELIQVVAVARKWRKA